MAARIYNLIEYREPIPDPIDDSTTNGLWERFIVIANQAVEFRDRETIDELKQLISQLEPSLEVHITVPGESN